jgi:hypothetical protein
MSPFANYNRGGRGRSDGKRSREEEAVEGALAGLPQPFVYESAKLPFSLHRTYTPDFSAEGIHVEVKGWWPPEDRAKLKAVRLANPNEIILVVLIRPELTISKGSKTTYAMWCDRWGINWVPYNKDPALLRQCLENALSRSINRVPSATVQMPLLFELTDPSSASAAARPAGPTDDPKRMSPTASSP